MYKARIVIIDSTVGSWKYARGLWT